VFNNTTDIKQYENLIGELKNAVNKTELQNALNANNNLSDKNLKIDIVFFDRNYTGNMKLKRAHVLTADGYREKWMTTAEDNAVLFLFVKEHGKADYEFRGLNISELLDRRHLFEKVMEFINEHLSGNQKTIVVNGSKYLARALTPVWTDAKRNAAETLIKEDRYKAGHINYFHNSWKSTFLDLKPISVPSQSQTTTLAKVWFLDKKDTLKTIAIYADTTVFKGTNITIEGEGYSFSFLGITIPVLFGNHQERVIVLELKNANNESQSYILPLVKALQESQKYSATKKVSEWDWQKSNKEFSLNSTTGLADIQTGNAFELIKISLNDNYPEGNETPVIHPWRSRTFCNVYASDLARDILFPSMFTSKSNYAPWGAHNPAAKLHDVLKDNTNGQFKSVTFNEAWEYTNAGYVVYLTAYNSKYYDGRTKDPYQYSGHIATCYQTNIETLGGNLMEANIIQAGSICGVYTFQKIWVKGKYGENNEYVKANLYLGYIIK
jgi:hypothetical protein